MRFLSVLRRAWREADHQHLLEVEIPLALDARRDRLDHPPLQPCPHQLELSRLRSQLLRMTVERNEAREALAEILCNRGEAS